MDLNAALEEAKRLLIETVDQVNGELRRTEYKEGKRLASSGQRELRDLKRKVTEAERAMRADFKQARLKVDKGGQAIGAFAGSKARGAMSRSRAAEKRRLAQRQADATDVYRKVKATIDDFISQLDKAKSTIDNARASHLDAKSAKPAPDPSKNQFHASEASLTSNATQPPPPPTPPMWAADPFGRYELRYWDGTKWTDQVASNGKQSIDPAT